MIELIKCWGVFYHRPNIYFRQPCFCVYDAKDCESCTKTFTEFPSRSKVFPSQIFCNPRRVGVFTLRLKPTAKNLSGHISGQVQFPNFSPLLTVSIDLYCLLLKAVPARCKKVFSSHKPPDSTASRATTVNRLAILTAVSQC